MPSIAMTVLAHQGGWDEMLMVLTPVAVFVLLLWLANSRANRARDERAPSAAAERPPADPGPGPATSTAPADPRTPSTADPSSDPSSGRDG